MKEFEGKTAIVTGAAQGIGESTAMLLAKKGAAVAVVDKNVQGAEEVVARIEGLGSEGLAIQADVTNVDEIQASVETTVSTLGRLDVLVNNASDIAEVIMQDLDVVSTDLECWDRSYAVNLRAPAAACKFAIPHMIESGGGSIINISSVNALAGDLVRCAYSATKAGLIMLSKSVATQFGHQGLRCNAVCPGLVLSPPAFAQENEPFLKIVDDSILTPHRGKPTDLANLIVFLASDEAAYVTGQTIAADGGLMSHMPYHAQVRTLGLG